MMSGIEIESAFYISPWLMVPPSLIAIRVWTILRSNSHIFVWRLCICVWINFLLWPHITITKMIDKNSIMAKVLPNMDHICNIPCLCNLLTPLPLPKPPSAKFSCACNSLCEQFCLTVLRTFDQGRRVS